jgi:hypothetical protein
MAGSILERSKGWSAYGSLRRGWLVILNVVIEFVIDCECRRQVAAEREKDRIGMNRARILRSRRRARVTDIAIAVVMHVGELGIKSSRTKFTCIDSRPG